jgi:uroporphyrinogen III methyltransferase/synthase
LQTVRGAELLGSAEVVFCDRQVHGDWLKSLPPQAEIIDLDTTEYPGTALERSGAGPIALLIARAREGKRVVWLKAGDPGWLERDGTEIKILAEAQVPFELIPGVAAGAAIAGNAQVPHWRAQRPLWGQSVVVTRPRSQAEALINLLRRRGAGVLEVPVIRTGAPKRMAPIREAITGLNGYDWIVFTSANGVTHFFNLFFKRFRDLRDIGGVRIAAVGPGTAAQIEALHLQVDLVPADFTADHVADALAKYESIENHRILLMRAEKANPELPRRLEDLGAIVDDIACYRTEAETGDESGDGQRLQARGADWITFTSGSTVEHFQARFDLPALTRKFPRVKLASIGPETSKVLRALGMEPAAEAKPHTAEGLVAAMEQARA